MFGSAQDSHDQLCERHLVIWLDSRQAQKMVYESTAWSSRRQGEAESSQARD